MNARFQIRKQDGRELTSDSASMFARLVNSGEVEEPDLIHDALTGEWTPARAHPVYRMIAQGIFHHGRRDSTL